MKNLIISTLVAAIATMGTASAQQSYAVLIAGNMQPNSQVIPLAEQWNGGIGAHPQHGFDEFWNDIYLQWEMLVIHKSYDNDNVMVLFGENGEDFTFDEQDDRYKAIYHQGYYSITDDNSKIGTITSTFAGLANTITEDDFLYVWIMSHGGTDGNGSYFYGHDNQKIYANELAALIGGIPAHKKVVVLSFPKSGGFLPELEADDTIVITAGGAAEGASRADEVLGERRELSEGLLWRILNIEY